MTLNGWHSGERSIQEKLGFAGPMSLSYTWISGDMPEQHRVFHSTRLPFVPITTLDERGRPWGSIFAGPDGQPGFISSPSDTKLRVRAKVWEGDPFRRNVELSKIDGGTRMLAAGIGIEFSTRRRNKFAGHINDIQREKEGEFVLNLVVNEAIGNCPKYVNVRELLPHPNTSPRVEHKELDMSSSERLPEDVISFIHEADTVFIGTTYCASKEDEIRYPSHVGMNQRGGRPGFVRVFPSDGRTIVLPDYSGNRLMTSLGNIETTPLASLTFVNFVNGDVLYLTGDAANVIRPASDKIMPGQKALTTIYTTGFTFIHDALPVRQHKNSQVSRSPYSPPIRLLAEELASTTSLFSPEEDVRALLSRIEIHSPTLATFTWQVSQDIHVKPGQAAILDFSSLVGDVQYQHMAALKPTSVNDDRIRTWTVSYPGRDSRELVLTMREKEGGAVTGALFSIARRLQQLKPKLLEDSAELGLAVRLVGISGEFFLPEGTSLRNQKRKSTNLLWAAGGIGLTPFLRMLSAISAGEIREQSWDIVLVLSTREPGVLIPLIDRALAIGKKTLRLKSKLQLEIYTNAAVNQALSGTCSWDVDTRTHPGRISDNLLEGLDSDREVFVCGPQEYESTVLAAASRVGISSSDVHREGFAF